MLSAMAVTICAGSMLLGSGSSALAQSRPEVSGSEAAVVAGHPLAAAAGAEALRMGGNAVDAAITMAAVLAVVRPHMNGVGGDAFLLIRDAATGEVHALNGSGRAGGRATIYHFGGLGLDMIPTYGPLSVSVPGAVRAWHDALEQYGTIPLAQALAPAIRYARQGFPVSQKFAADVAAARDRLAQDPDMAAIFLPDGAPPRAGTSFRQPDLARTLDALANGGADEFYRGGGARAIATFMEEAGGLLTLEDLSGHTSSWQEPLETSYRGYRVMAFPPNTQGVALLSQLNMAEAFDVAGMGHNSASYVHTLVEIKRLAFADRDRHVTDPTHMEVSAATLVSKERAGELLAELRERAQLPATTAGPRRDGPDNTVYLAAVDRAGNAVSMIQSLFHAFGSARMVPGTGVVLQNRGSSFSLDPAHVNVVAPGKRPYHTLIPAMALHPDGELFVAMGTPGGDGQTQTLVQVLNNLILFGMSPQQAVEAARWRSYESLRLDVEPGIDDAAIQLLGERGHHVRVQPPSAVFGGVQLIVYDPATGFLRAGADMRREAQAIAW